jgi:hypothetical protein
MGAGTKLCYIRLLGFAGRDARCYPSLERWARVVVFPSGKPGVNRRVAFALDK